VLLAHVCNPSYSGGKDQEDHGWKPAWGKLDPVSKIPNTKRTGGVVREVECLPSKHEAMSSDSSTIKRQKKAKMLYFTQKHDQSRLFVPKGTKVG
jgi:hypothetical protein